MVLLFNNHCRGQSRAEHELFTFENVVSQIILASES